MGKVNNEYVAGLISSCSMESYGTILEILRKRDEFVENGSKESVGDDYPGITAEHLEEISRNSQADSENLIRLDALLSAKAQASAAPEQEPVARVCGGGSSTHHSCPDGHSDILSEYLPVDTEHYTHADPSEVERLRVELAESDLCVVRALNERDAALKQLAKAQALVRKFLDGKKPVRELVGDCEAFLSAAAQPADGVKSDE